MPADRGLLRGEQRGRSEQGKKNKSAETHLHWLLKGLDNLLRLQMVWFPGQGVGTRSEFPGQIGRRRFAWRRLSHN
jgi:hypothetical protein